MSAPVRLEDIEEFEIVRRIPRGVINDSILDGVHQLNEKEVVEPFLRDILPDKNETAHTSTEIADILTTHVTHAGHPVLAAFVNKGKATPKVRARDIAHQVIRLRQIHFLGLMVLLAVGNIQDDAKRDFLQVAKDGNVDYMIVDAIDVARLFIAFHKICPKDGNPYRDGRCQKCGTPVTKPIKLTLDVYEEPIYTTLSLNDICHGLAKRYSANILTDSHYPKATIREVIKRATWELGQSRYYRSNQTKSHFGDRDADCVFLFVYPTLQDTQTFNWICRTAWVRPDLPEGSRPANIGGDEWLGEIEVDWNENYHAIRNYFHNHVGKKEVWIQKIDTHIPKIDIMVQDAKRLLEIYGKNEIEQQEFQETMKILEPKSLRIFLDTSSQEFPPLECKECDDFFQRVVCSFHNIFVPFMAHGQEIWDWGTRLNLMRDNLKRYEEDLNGFRHEWRKVRT